jgi:hypothetical protein
MCNSRWGKWRVVLNTVMNFRIPWGAGNLLTSRGTVSLSSVILLHVLSWLDYCTYDGLPCWRWEILPGFEFGINRHCTGGTWQYTLS